jgi:hypothetical protein
MFFASTKKKQQRLRRRANRLLYRIQKLEAEYERVTHAYRRSFGPDVRTSF